MRAERRTTNQVRTSLQSSPKQLQHIYSLIVQSGEKGHSHVLLFKFQLGHQITLTTTRVYGTAWPMSQMSWPSREEISSTSLARSASTSAEIIQHSYLNFSQNSVASGQTSRSLFCHSSLMAAIPDSALDLLT